MNKILALTPIIFLILIGSAQCPGRCELLQGRIEHSDSVEPVQQDLRPGAVLNPKLLKEQAQGNNWYEIPFWLAGTWQQDFSTQIRMYRYATGENTTPNKTRKDVVSRTYGDQMDENGRIWSFDNCPFTVTGNYDDKTTYSIFRSFAPQEITTNSVTFRSLQLSVLSDPKTRTVLATTVKESITRFERMGKDRCSTLSSVKVFDVDGNPLEIYDVKSTRVKTAAFAAREFDAGHNLPALFQRFTSHNGSNN